MNNNRYSRIGFDMGPDSIKLIQLQRTPDGLTVRDMRMVEIGAMDGESDEESGGVKDEIRKALHESSFTGKLVVSTLPDYKTDIIPLKLTSSTQEELEEAIIRDAKTYLTYKVNEAVIDYLAVNDGEYDSEGSGNIRSILVAVKREDIDEHLSILKCAHLKPAAIDVRACALQRIFMKSEGVQKGNVLLIHMDELETSLTIFCDEAVFFDRSIQWGSRNILQGLMEGLSLNRRISEKLLEKIGLLAGFDEVETVKREGILDVHRIADVVHEIVIPYVEKLAGEIEKVLAYFSSETRGGTIDSIHLSGSAYTIRNMEGFIEERLGIPARLFDPLDALGVKEDEEFTSHFTQAPRFTVALGLALRGMDFEEEADEGEGSNDEEERSQSDS